MEVFEIQQGVPYSGIVYLTNETVVPSTPLDITGLTIFISVKRANDNKNDDSSAVISSKITEHTDPTLGVSKWELTKAETLVPLGRYVADARIYTSDEAFVNSVTFYVDIVPIVTKRLA